jgi:hypothetical protein
MNICLKLYTRSERPLHLITIYHTLQVDIAKWIIINGAQQIPNLPRLHIQEIRLDNIIQRSRTTRRFVVQRNRPGNRTRLVQVQGLPEPVDTVDHGVVHEENGVVGAAEKVASVAADGEMPCGVHAEEAVVKAALELVLEQFDGFGGGAEGHVVEVFEREPACGCSCSL